jgi:hypothetical protein
VSSDSVPELALLPDISQSPLGPDVVKSLLLKISPSFLDVDLSVYLLIFHLFVIGLHVFFNVSEFR